MLFLRALAAFLILPVVLGFLVPWFLLLPADPWRLRGTDAGWTVLAIGLVILLWTVRDFYVRGKGTLAPWDPPKTLVIAGLYRYCRNPMYVGVLGFVVGLGLVTGSPLVVGYAMVLAIGFHWRVVLYEEPVLAKLFGEDWEWYRARVRRWGG